MSVIPQNSKVYDAFSPLSIPGCRFWLDADDSSSVTLSGSNVTGWRDKTGINTTVTVTGSPTYATTTRLNNRYAVTFNGTSNSILYSGFTLAQPFTAFAVTVQRGSTPSGYSQVIGSSSGTSAVILYTQVVPTALTFYAGNNVVLSPNVQYSLNITGVYSAVFNSTSSYLGFNGTGQSNLNPGTLAWNGIYLGRDFNATYTAHDVGEILFYNTALTTSQRQQVEGYLARKWGLTSSLPVTHPHKLLPIFSRDFRPLDITGCTLWLDSADRSTITLNAGNVSQWNDKSGNGYNLTQGTAASQPLYTNNIVTFSSDRYLNIPQAAINNAATYSLFFVFTPNSATNWIMAKQQDGVNTYNVLSMTRYVNSTGTNTVGTTSYMYWKVNNAGTLLVNTAPAFVNGTKILVRITYNASTLVMFRNGTSTNSIASTISAIPNATAATNYTMGAWIRSGAIQNTGLTSFALNEMLFFNGTLTTNQIQQIESYLAWKWDLRNSLPAASIYKLYPPLTPIFNPLSISGCQLWLDGLDPNGTGILPSNGATVSTWVDKSGVGNNATSVGTTPTFATNSISFGGAGYYNTNYSAALANQTFFIVYQWTNISNDSTLIGGSQLNQIILYASPSLERWPYVGAIASWGRYASSPAMIANTRYLVNFTWSSSNTTMLLYVNGTAPTLIDVNTPSAFSGTPTYTQIGASYNTASFTGNMYEIIGYNVTLTNAQRQQIEGYLAWKWGIQKNFPASQPYKLLVP